MKEKLMKNRNFIDRIIILIVALILALPIFSSYLNVYFDDGIQHIARAYGTLQSIKQQGLFPNIISSFTNNFGYSWNLFYGPLSTYGIILVNFLCKNFTVSYKILCFISLIFSGIFMYEFVFSFSQNRNTALLSGIIYMSFPYHLTDFYIRNALGEYLSFTFIPLVFLGLYNLFNNTENNYYLAFGAIGLILTHNLSTVIVAIVAFIYLILNIKTLKETRVKKGLFINFIFIITVTSFFWAPLIETKFESNYQVYEKGAMATSESVSENSLGTQNLFVTSGNATYVFELGLHTIIMLCFSVLTLKLIKDSLKKDYKFFLICGIITAFMSTVIFPWKYLPECFSIIQFPWRLLMITAFFFSVVCAINMSYVIKKFNIRDALIISIISVIYVYALGGYVPYTEEPVADINNYELGVMSGKDIETVAGTAKAEYLPVNAYNNRFYIATREDAIYVLEGKAIIEDEQKDGSHYTAEIETIKEQTLLELPYIYYPGYEVTADGMVLDVFETENGFLGVILDENDNVSLEINYVGTDIMKISSLISGIAFIIFLIYVWKKH